MPLFAACRMRTFARLISDELGVRVVLKGKEILVRGGRPPVIHLPAMEYGSEEAIAAVRGFALHEAGHVKYSDFRVCREITSYSLKELHNALEDEYVEHRLERRFPGGREMLVAAHREGLELVNGRPESIRQESWLSPGSRADILDRFKATARAEYLRRNPGAPKADADKAAEESANALTDDQVGQVAKRFELRRAALCWLYKKRGYDKWVNLHEWDTHPWKPVFDEETKTRARNSWEALDQARRIMERLGTGHPLPGDERPADKLRELAAKAKAAKHAARDARRLLRKAEAEVRDAVRKVLEGSPEHAELRDAESAHAHARKAAERQSGKANRAAERTVKARERLDRATARLDALRKRLEACTDERQREVLQEQVDLQEGVVERHRERLAECQRRESVAGHEREKANKALAEAKERLTKAEEAHSTLQKALWEKERGERAAELERLEAEFKEAKKNAEAAIEEWRRLSKEVKERDKAGEEPIQPGVRAKVVARAWDKHRDQPFNEDVASLSPKDVRDFEDKHGEPDFGGTAKNYAVFDRALDTVERVEAGQQAKADHDRALREQAGLIDQLVASLRRLNSPVQSRVKVNVERGRLDPKRLYRAGMALRSAPVDARRVWKTVVTKPDPKVAVSVLLDCSGSMTQCEKGGKTRIQVAIRAAAALSEAMRRLCIPHEILGHTTHLHGRQSEGVPDLEFSRFVPFRGYVFKPFRDENAEPSSLFSQYDMAENLDGEAVLWAARRLEERTEKTRVLVVISDGLPAASPSNTAELERHLLTVCRTLEAQAGEGMHLHAVGIGVERVKAFYKNAEVIGDVVELPRAVVKVVDRVVAGVTAPGQSTGFGKPDPQTYLTLD